MKWQKYIYYVCNSGCLEFPFVCFFVCIIFFLVRWIFSCLYYRCLERIIGFIGLYHKIPMSLILCKLL